MEEWEQDKLFAIAEYLDEEIPDSRATIQPISPASPVYVLTVRTAKKLYGLKVHRSLIEDRDIFVSTVKGLLVRDDLARTLESSKGEYTWNPVA
jgi:hypothetical protein